MAAVEEDSANCGRSVARQNRMDGLFYLLISLRLRA